MSRMGKGDINAISYIGNKWCMFLNIVRIRIQAKSGRDPCTCLVASWAALKILLLGSYHELHGPTLVNHFNINYINAANVWVDLTKHTQFILISMMVFLHPLCFFFNSTVTEDVGHDAPSLLSISNSPYALVVFFSSNFHCKHIYTFFRPI